MPVTRGSTPRDASAVDQAGIEQQAASKFSHGFRPNERVDRLYPKRTGNAMLSLVLLPIIIHRKLYNLYIGIIAEDDLFKVRTLSTTILLA